jgi:hypothetical protein
MVLSDELIAQIDAMPYVEMLRRWRFTAIGDPLFQGDSGDYFNRRMRALRSLPDGNAVHAAACKAVGMDE